MSIHISQYTFWAAVAFICGTALAPAYFVVGGVILLVAYYKVSLVSRLWFAIVVIGAFVAGLYHYSNHIPATVATIPFEESVELTGTIAQPPIQKANSQKIYLDTADVPGNVYIKTGRYPQYAYGDELSVRCTLIAPEPFDTFAFDKYLARYSIFSICRQAQIYRVSERQGNGILHWLYDVRAWFRTEIRELWPEPVASLMLGVLLGIQDDIPEDIVEQFRITGTIHVLVVSGMHVVIIAQLLTKALQGSLSAKQRFIAIGCVLAGFCIITGLQASVLRAAIMGMLPLLAELLHRRATIHNSLVVVAGVMAIINPYVVLHDMGFQLSFLATIGLVYFQPVCDKACWWIPQQFTIRETVSTTIAATIPTTPLILSTFGTFSVVSLFANLIVVPVSTLMLFGSTVVIAVKQVAQPLAVYIAYGLHIVVKTMLYIVQQLSNVPNALLENLVVPPSVIITSYVVMLLYIIYRVKIVNSKQNAYEE